MITLTAKVQVLPDIKQAELLKATMSMYRDACNYVSDYISKTHDIGQASLHKAVYHDLRAIYELPSQMACSVMRTVIASYKTILSTQHAWIAPVYKNLFCDLCWNKDYGLKQDYFSVNTLVGRIKLKYCNQGVMRYFDGTWKFGTAELVYKHKKFFLCISVEKAIPELQIANVNNIVGVDLGINFLATAYDSHDKTVFYHGRHVKQKRAQFKKTRQSLQKRKTASARRKLKKIGQRENRWMSDVNHQVSKALVTRYPAGTMFVLEDLTGIRSQTEKVRRKDRYVMVSWAFFDLRKKIEYKAKLYGHTVIFVDPRYTSQTCPKCGCVDKHNRNKRAHVFTCKCCGYTSNDDRIGAMNLHQKGILYRQSAVMCE